MTYTDAEDFLAHVGKKGMKWGQRKQQISDSITNFKNNPKVRTAGKIAGAAVIIGATAFVAAKLAQRGRIPVSKVDEMLTKRGQEWFSSGFKDGHFSGWDSAKLSSLRGSIADVNYSDLFPNIGL